MKLANHGSGKFRFAVSKDGLIAYDKHTPMTIRFDVNESNELIKKRVIKWDELDHYCEVAHLEISNRCNMNCWYCYTGDKKAQELSTKEWKYIIDNLADSGIFQVSFGGGEPTMREDMLTLAEHVMASGMNLGMTTNGLYLPDSPSDYKRSLKFYFKQINISWHQNAEVVERALRVLRDFEIPAGINYAFSQSMKDDNETVKMLAKEYNAELLYLVYKPINMDFKEQVDPEVVMLVAKETANERIKTAVDGPCAGKCLMKVKFVDVDSLGYVYPCSFVRKPLGNLLVDRFDKIWKERGPQDECPYVKFKEIVK